ncbi:hypothetical protein [Tunicatimonas pelagia]|uniref:hypothetical protein n=1 Tax=Tunicatimonas pelagia TaxID=931531 RepID=UPI002666C801|nr:hypothetical protein [Tunicatimonas pelagia]WKN46491.1 hypothetical protein P0M28_30540 [Tunicatimonas pelagia]
MSTKEIHAAIITKLEAMPWLFTPIEREAIPRDEQVVVKCNNGYAVHVYWYSEVCQQAFREWQPIAWANSSELDTVW